MRNNSTRVNERITAHRIRLILADGENKGEMLKTSAIEMARRDGFDLVEVSGGTIPVCKIMDYGKFLYDQSKKQKHQQHAPQMKEIYLKYKTDPHDIGIKTKKINEFLAGGHKVKITMKLKGREIYVGAGQPAREKFYGIVKEFNPALKLSDIKENDRAFTFILHPSSD